MTTTEPTNGSGIPCTDRNALLASVEETFRSGLDLIKKKNQDYGATSDPFRNFQMATLLDLSVEQGILLRVLDKIARLNNLLTKAPAVADESRRDTITDAINYLAILQAWWDLHPATAQFPPETAPADLVSRA